MSSAWHTCKAAAAETGQRDSVPQSSMGGRRGPKLRLWGQWRSSPSLSRANRKHFRCVRGAVSVPQSDQPRLSSRCPPGRVGVGKHPMVASKRLPGAAGPDPSALVNLCAESCPGQPGAFRAVCSATCRLRHLHVPSRPMPPASGCRLQPHHLPPSPCTSEFQNPGPARSQGHREGRGEAGNEPRTEGAEVAWECCVWPGNWG